MRAWGGGGGGGACSSPQPAPLLVLRAVGTRRLGGLQNREPVEVLASSGKVKVSCGGVGRKKGGRSGRGERLWLMKA